MAVDEKIRCYRCLGKRLEYGVVGRRRKPHWHECQVCQGKGWLPLSEDTVWQLADALADDPDHPTSAEGLLANWGYL